jgi:hypothetical protein
MAFAPEEKLAVYAQAMRDLLQLEPNPARRLKDFDFIESMPTSPRMNASSTTNAILKRRPT